MYHQKKNYMGYIIICWLDSQELMELGFLDEDDEYEDDEDDDDEDDE